MQKLRSHVMFFLGIYLIGCASCSPIPLNQPVRAPGVVTMIAAASPSSAPSFPPTMEKTAFPTAQQPDTALPAQITDRETDRETAIKNCEELLTAFQQKMKTTGWIRKVFTIVYFDNRKQEYWPPQIKEEWYRFDSDNKLVEGYNWVSTPDGAIVQEAIYQGGYTYNLTFGGSSRGYHDRVDFTAGFLDKLKSGAKIAQAEVIYQGKRSWQFTHEIDDGGIRAVEALYIDQESGLITGAEFSVVQPDGSLKLVSGSVAIQYEIDADPPLARFAELLEKAQKMR